MFVCLLLLFILPENAIHSVFYVNLCWIGVSLSVPEKTADSLPVHVIYNPWACHRATCGNVTATAVTHTITRVGCLSVWVWKRSPAIMHQWNASANVFLMEWGMANCCFPLRLRQSLTFLHLNNWKLKFKHSIFMSMLLCHGWKWKLNWTDVYLI